MTNSYPRSRAADLSAEDKFSSRNGPSRTQSTVKGVQKKKLDLRAKRVGGVDGSADQQANSIRSPLFVLIDCNNFFVSCEKVFRPDLEGIPCVVASSNDGCVVARSQEARAIGIPMGAPVFKHRALFDQHKVQIFSANFELYGDISRRITELLTTITPRMEIYSIDESFLDISHLDINDYEAWGREIKARIEALVGVPVSVGIAPTKTLAKLASERAKKDPDTLGVAYIASKDHQQWGYMLGKTPLEDIWGIGWGYAPKLRSLGLASALDIAKLPPITARQLFHSVHGERLVRELNCQSCLPLERIKTGAHMASATRTFGQDIYSFSALEAALASFVARAAHRMRTQGMRARRISIFMNTNRHKPQFRRFYAEIKLPCGLSDTGALSSVATKLLTQCYQKGVPYYRAGVTLHDLEPDTGIQADLLGFVDVKEQERRRTRMALLDRLNDKYGRRTLHFASEDITRAWEPRRKLSSPRYTTNWDDLPKITIAKNRFF